jgi:hypothetical protein
MLFLGESGFLVAPFDVGAYRFVKKQGAWVDFVSSYFFFLCFANPNSN